MWIAEQVAGFLEQKAMGSDSGELNNTRIRLRRGRAPDRDVEIDWNLG